MFARTERLMLRPGWPEDAPALAQAIADEAIVRNLATAPWPYTLADAEAFLAQPEEPALPRFLIFARTRGAPRLVGGIGLGRAPDGETEIGYWIARRCWGLGFASEAGRAVIALAHHGLRLPRLAAEHHRDNHASARVLRKLGFRPTGETAMRRCAARRAEVPCLRYARAAADGLPSADGARLAA